MHKHMLILIPEQSPSNDPLIHPLPTLVPAGCKVRKAQCVIKVADHIMDFLYE